MKIRAFVLFVLMAAVVLPGMAQKIFLTGDSHVSAKVYPRKVKSIVEAAKPSADVKFWGNAGAGFYTFNDTPAYMDSIYNAAPDILIVHLGTNGCYNVPLDPEKTLNDIETFYGNVRNKLPECKIVFVTPFYNKNRDITSPEGMPKTYGPWKVNKKTRQCSDIIVAFAADKPNTYVIDNNADAGTVFVDSKGLIRQDNIHLTEKGYELLGRQVAGKLLEISDLWTE